MKFIAGTTPCGCIYGKYWNYNIDNENLIVYAIDFCKVMMYNILKSKDILFDRYRR